MSLKKCSAAVILHDGKYNILLGHSIKHDSWELPGGKHEMGETSQGCAWREVAEETGISIELPLTFVGFNEDDNFLCMIYSAQTGIVTADVMEPDKHRTWRWVNILELPRPLRPVAREAILLWVGTHAANAAAVRNTNTVV